MSAVAVPFVDLRGQHDGIDDELREAVERVVRSSRFVLGSEGEAFEDEFAAYCGARHCVGLGSGTDALELALRACGIGEGDEVVVPSQTFVATAFAVSQLGATPVFVDVDPVTYTVDPGGVAAALTPRTRAIVPVHLYGQPAEMAPLEALARDRGLFLIEDAAQAHGAEYHGRRAGSLGRLACFSFYPTKNLGALGDAGAVVTSDAELADRVRRLRDYGRIDKYLHASLGFNSRLDELQAAVLRVKLAHLERWNEERRRAAARYSEALAGVVGTPVEADGRRHVYHLYVVRTRERDALAAALSAQGIATQVHYPVPAHLQPAYRELPCRAGSLQETEEIATEILSLPMFPAISDAQIDRVVEAVRAARG